MRHSPNAQRRLITCQSPGRHIRSWLRRSTSPRGQQTRQDHPNLCVSLTIVEERRTAPNGG